MAILRSREIISNESTEKTLEKEQPPPPLPPPSLDPPTPIKSDAIGALAQSSPAVVTRRRSLRLAGVASPIPVQETISGRKRKARVSKSPIEWEIRVLNESGSMTLPSSARVEKTGAMMEIEVGLRERLDFDASVVEEKSKGVDEFQLRENGEVIKEGTEAVMNMGSGTRVYKRRAIAEENKGDKFDLKENLNFEEVAIEEKLNSVNENGETVGSTIETVTQERLSYKAKGKGKDISFADSIEMAIENDDTVKGKLVVDENHSSIEKDAIMFEDTQFPAQEVGEGLTKGRRAGRAKHLFVTYP